MPIIRSMIAQCNTCGAETLPRHRTDTRYTFMDDLRKEGWYVGSYRKTVVYCPNCPEPESN